MGVTQMRSLNIDFRVKLRDIDKKMFGANVSDFVSKNIPVEPNPFLHVVSEVIFFFYFSRICRCKPLKWPRSQAPLVFVSMYVNESRTGCGGVNLILSTLFWEVKVVLLSAGYTDVILKVKKFIFVRNSAWPVLAYNLFHCFLEQQPAKG